MYTFIGMIGEMEPKYRRVSLSKFCAEEKKERKRVFSLKYLTLHCLDIFISLIS